MIEEDEEENVTRFELDEDKDDLLVDLSDRSKPEVKELTMGDAEEYFQDLGLEYNVDYVDVSTDKNTLKKEDDKPKEKNEDVEEIVEEAIEEVVEDIPVQEEKEEEVEKEEVKEETTESVKDEDNDNLFDLIDSMYQDE